MLFKLNKYLLIIVYANYKKKIVLRIKFEVSIIKILLLHDFAHFNIFIARLLGFSCKITIVVVVFLLLHVLWFLVGACVRCALYNGW